MESFANYTVATNETFLADHGPSKVVRTFFDVGVIICMLTMMLAMGCEVAYTEILSHLRKPLGIIVGMLCQFLLMPFLGFTAIKALSIEGLHAASILILSCSPGGGYSNIMAYLSKGDVPLSVAMTTISNVLALGMTPLNVWIYSNAISTGSIKIPFLQMFISMTMLTLILGIGVITRWKRPNIASVITKIGVIASGLMALACGVLAIVLYPDFIKTVPWFIYAAVAFVAPIGIAVAYCMAWLCKLEGRIRRTIAIESAVQNIGTAITICILSFSTERLKEMSMYIILYGGFTVSILLLVSGTIAGVSYCQNKGGEKPNEKMIGNEFASKPITML